MKNTKTALFQSVVALLLCVSMLVGTTMAWFTDSVTTGVNQILSGNLDVELVDAAGKSLEGKSLTFLDVNGNANILWEPGCTFKTQGFRVSNEGNLALKYTMYINGLLGDSKLLEVIEFSLLDEQGKKVDIDSFEGKLSANSQSGLYYLVGHMTESANNDYQGLTLQGVGITVHAAQATEESDSFDNTYDKGAQWPQIPGVWKVTAPVSVTNGAVSAETTVGGTNDRFTAKVPTGVQVEAGVEELELEVSTLKNSEANVTLQQGQVGLSLDVHMDGVAEGNTVPMIINLGKIAPTGLYNGNISLYHVENGATIPMVQVDTLAELDAHNEFYYDSATGEVSLSMASFSEVYAAVAVANPWNGTDVSFDWYTDPSADMFTLDSAADLFGFAQVVGGMNGQTQNSFENKTVKLAADINLGGCIWYPIGYNNSDGTYVRTGTAITSGFYAFKGTFDGDYHTITNFHQNTWEMKGSNSHYDAAEQYYNDGMGLFGLIDGGTVQNLVIDGMVAEGEFTDIGCVAAYARGECKFTNIRISKASCYSYNCRTAGIVGYDWIGDNPSNLTFSNIEIDPTNTFGALWGSWDVACAGILGYMNDTSTVNFTNCEVGCELDVFNDVCANYQYYDYRYAGMMIGTVGKDGDTSDMPGKINFSDCTIHYRDWVNHYHCELVANSEASYTHDYQMSRLVKISNLAEIQNADGSWKMAGNFVILGATEADHKCYHIMKDAEGKLYQHKHEDSGTETIDGQEVLKEDKQIVHTVFNQIYTGYGWGAISVAPGAEVNEAKYTITYINNGKVLDVTYVTDNSASFSTAHEDAANLAVAGMGLDKDGKQYEFNYWMNAASVQMNSIDAGNENDIILYPSFKDKYTIMFVDQDGTVIHWEIFTVGQTALAFVPAVPAIEGGYTGAWSEYDLNTKSDITVRPIYNADDGIVKLTPVDKEPQDGVVDYYQVTSVEENDNNVNIVIPSTFNGKPVLEVADGAFAEFDNITTVRIPVSITSIGVDAFANKENSGFLGALKYEQITFLYEGTYEQWQAIKKDENWDRYVGQGSKIYFLADGTYSEETARNGTWNAEDRVWSDPKAGTYTS